MTEPARQKSLRDRVLDLMRDGQWRTLREIEAVTGGSATGISAKMRDLRKQEFGAHYLCAENQGDGVWLYRLTVNRATVEPVQLDLFEHKKRLW